ncbi:MAG: hypothetical protein K2H56_03640 [Malacoplasma sp.]|nr:hypothetical protein [Malacoplasma sp.]MDE7099991.1 hypothetical protein [Malacoplasma sp.]
MFWKKKDKKSKLQEEYNKKYQKNYATNETTLINLDDLKKDSESILIYNRFSKLSYNELLYKLENEELEEKEKEIISVILNERKNQK